MCQVIRREREKGEGGDLLFNRKKQKHVCCVEFTATTQTQKHLLSKASGIKSLPNLCDVGAVLKRISGSARADNREEKKNRALSKVKGEKRCQKANIYICMCVFVWLSVC